MAYNIAVGSTDGINIDLKFGEVQTFLIYKVEGTTYELLEKREVSTDDEDDAGASCGEKSCDSSGCSGSGHGCNGSSDVAKKVLLIADTRAVVCKKIGFQAQKQFEKKAISVFDIECPVKDALDRIVAYYDKIDSRKSLRS